MTTVTEFDIGGDDQGPEELPPPAADPDVSPAAPYGVKADGTPKLSNGGRPRKSTGRTARKSTATRAPRPRTETPKIDKPKPAAKLTISDKLVGLAEVAMPLIPDPVDQNIVHAFAGSIAQQWEAAAAENDKVRRFFDSFGGGAALPTAALTTAAMVALIAINHGAFRRTRWGAGLRARFLPAFDPELAEQLKAGAGQAPG